MDRYQECPHVAPSVGSAQYIGDPDLVMLREDLADEMGAIVGYRECAAEIKDHRLSRQFREVANDEVGHFIRLMRMIAMLDPIQAEELRKQNLIFLTGSAEPAYPLGVQSPAYHKHKAGNEEERNYASEPKKHYFLDERVWECLRNAIRDELHAIDAYQKQIQAAVNPNVNVLLTTIMNKEKEHVAEFTRLFFELQHST